MRGILRKQSPTRSNKVTVVSARDNSQAKKPPATIINHNQNISPNIPAMLNGENGKSSNLLLPAFQSSMVLTQKKQELLRSSLGKIERTAELTPKTKAAVTEKVVKKLNIPNGRNVYKELAPVNVNDSVLGLSHHRTRRTHSIKKEFASNADPEPVLKDYLRPTISLTHTIELTKKVQQNPKKVDTSAAINSFANECFVNLRETYEELLKPKMHMSDGTSYTEKII